MQTDEANRESLECARYGEDEDLKDLYVSNGADVNYADETGTTAMHRAAANGEVGCLKVLKHFGAIHSQNLQGNYPMHWAALNAQEAALKFIFENYEVDVLVKNGNGRSTLSEAFQTQKTEIIEICLSHSSASEENLLKTDADTKVSVDGAYDKNAVLHEMDFGSSSINANTSSNVAGKRNLKVRELPITRADNPFGSDTAPEDDTTGLGLWPAAVLLSRWLVQKDELLRGKVVVELGAGCGLPALAAALYCGPEVVYLTDIHDPTLSNAAYNARLNVYNPEKEDDGMMNIKMTSRTDEKYIEEVTILNSQKPTPIDLNQIDISMNIDKDNTNSIDLPVSSTLIVSKVSWSDPLTFPPKADILLGSDLVYDAKILTLLTQAVDGMLKPGGTFLYVAPDECRDGIDGLIGSLKGVGIQCVMNEPCPEWMYENPLIGQNDEDSMDLDTKDDTNNDEMEVENKPEKEGKKTVVDRGDQFVLHFYDLAARKPHSLYQFEKIITV